MLIFVMRFKISNIKLEFLVGVQRENLQVSNLVFTNKGVCKERNDKTVTKGTDISVKI